jgi:hypothetical protein
MFYRSLREGLLEKSDPLISIFRGLIIRKHEMRIIASSKMPLGSICFLFGVLERST